MDRGGVPPTNYTIILEASRDNINCLHKPKQVTKFYSVSQLLQTIYKNVLFHRVGFISYILSLLDKHTSIHLLKHLTFAQNTTHNPCHAPCKHTHTYKVYWWEQRSSQRLVCCCSDGGGCSLRTELSPCHQTIGGDYLHTHTLTRPCLTQKLCVCENVSGV